MPRSNRPQPENTVKPPRSNTLDIEQLKNYEEQLEEVATEQKRLAKEYYDARISHAKNKAFFNREISKVLVDKAGKDGYRNMGAERAEFIMLGNWAKVGNEAMFEKYEQYLVSRGTYKGLEEALKAHQNCQTSIQSRMRYAREGDTYGV